MAGVSRTILVDDLGRLKQVTENGVMTPNNTAAVTAYAYDALDDLTTVTPPNACGMPSPYACNGRTFSYSSLKRLTSATNEVSVL